MQNETFKNDTFHFVIQKHFFVTQQPSNQLINMITSVPIM